MNSRNAYPWALGLSLLALMLPVSAMQGQLGGLLKGLGDKEKEETRPHVAVRALATVTSLARGELMIEVNKMRFRIDTTSASPNQVVRPGDEVRVSGELLQSDLIKADSVVLVKRGTLADTSSATGSLSGKITAINRNEDRLTLTTDTGVVQIRWTEATGFVRSEKAATENDFRVGDPIRVSGQRTGPDAWRALRIYFGGKPGWSADAVGTVVAINSRTEELEVDYSGDVWVVRAKQAELRRGPRRVDLDAIRIGSEIKASGTPRTGKVLEASLVEIMPAR